MFGALVTTTSVLAAGYTVTPINTPGSAYRMSSSGAFAGSYITKCTKLGGQPNYEICYAAPWYYDGQTIHKLSSKLWTKNGYALTYGINNSFDLVGQDTRTGSGGGWLYSGGTVTYSGSLPQGGDSTLNSINNNHVAVGMATNSVPVSRAVTFQNGVLSEVPAFSSNVWTAGVDINDAGWIAAWYRDIDKTDHAFVYMNGPVATIPLLAGTTNCYPKRISQQSGWVAGVCSDRGFLYNVTVNSPPMELLNLSGGSGGIEVWSVNSNGVVVGSVSNKAVVWPKGSANPVDLTQYVPGPWMVSRAMDINDAGTIVANFVDSAGHISTNLLNPIP